MLEGFSSGKPRSRKSKLPARLDLQHGAGMVEYMVLTGILVAVLLTPFSMSQESQRASVLQRLIDAMFGELFDDAGSFESP